MAKKQAKKQKLKVSKEQLMKESNRIDEEEQMEDKTSLEPQREESAHAQETDPPHADSHADPDGPQATVTSTQSTKRSSGAPRSVCAMHKVVMKKAQGKKFKVRYNEIGVPVGDTRHTLQSYIGMIARTMVPIDIPSWPHVDPELKQKLWIDVQNTFKVLPESEKHVLQSAGSKWRQFKANLTRKYVIPYVGQKKKLAKPPKEYGFVCKGAWKRFVALRTTADWMELNKKQSEIVKRRKYPHRASRKGYIGLEEEEVNSGRLAPGEVPDRAILWKRARKPNDPTIEIDEELLETFEKIDSLLEMKRKGEFKPSGSSDVLTTALETPEHAGRVRGVGNFVSVSTFFNMPKGKRSRVTKDELLARDKKREDEFEKRTQEFDKKTDKLMSEIAELKALMNASNFHSPILSDKSSCRGEKEQKLDDEQKLDEEMKVKDKPAVAKELMPDIDRDNDCFAIDPNDPPPSEIKGPRFCELAVDNLDNKVAFGMVVDDGDMDALVHPPLKPGFLRVLVDGIMKPDALVPVPIAGEIETVHQAVGSYLPWPKDLIIFITPTVEKKKELQKKKKGELQRVQTLFETLKMNENVPGRFKLLYKHANCFMKESGVSIQLPCDVGLFGIERTIFLLHENLIALLEFKMIGQAIISTYMSYLHTIVREKDSLGLYAFVDPSIHKLNDDFEAYVVQRLKDGVLRINFMPYNQNCHWILIIIWESEIFVLNPLSHPTHFTELEKALMRAVRSFNAQTGRVNKNPKVKNLSGSPKQPGGIECGYVVMRYMKEIIEDKEMKLINLWGTKTRKTYTKEELDVVRFEALDYIQAIM